ncbi:hypothetical protein RJ639_011687 [Escallonia herrerae]|uniref:H15 domain-containing protein n=1 Tax=Escallonia herrerae TaxID=1293975 RepID=A0AA88VPP9_9ASTE|nr:hypothetical protein RJ639_011687 [Escallonia herrerae]
MSATGEVDQATAEQPQAEEKPVKEKKPKTAKVASHPPYFQMIKEALLALNESGGSSPYAIAKYMEEKHNKELPANFRKILGLQLKNSATRGKLIKIKASYKLSEAGKKDSGVTKDAAKTDGEEKKSRPAAKATAETGAPPRRKAAERSEAAKTKPVKQPARKAKKAAPAKARQPRSIRSPTAKKGKSVTAMLNMLGD